MRVNNVIVNWMVRRTEPSESIKLVHKNCYIFPNRYGLLFLGLLIIMAVGATNYQNNLAYSITFLLASMGLLSIFLTFRNVVGVTVKCGSVKPVFVGDDILYPVYLSSDQREHYALGVGIDGKIQHYVNVNENNPGKAYLNQKTTKRGIAKIDTVYIASKFPFGLMRCWTWLPLKLEGLVYPAPIEPKLYMNTSHIDNEEGNETKAGSNDFEQIREYQKGDPLKHIDWKVYARERGLFTKQFSEEVGDSSMIDWRDFETSDEEMILSYMCFLVLAADKEQRKVGLNLPNKCIEPDAGRRHIEHCLKSLALYDI